MSWALAYVAGALLLYSALTRRLATSSLTAPIFFVSAGLLGGVLFKFFGLHLSNESIKLLAEATLVVVLFSDASRIRLDQLRRGYSVPLRLLGIGLPLTIALGAVLALWVVPGLDLGAALVLAITLAPTDAALGQVVVTDKRLPARVSQGLNVEGGLNDGICVPLLFVALAIMRGEAGKSAPLTILAEQLGYGVLMGLVAGALGGAVLRFALHRGWVSDRGAQVLALAAALLAYGLAAPLGGSGFIAAFVGGVVFGVVFRRSASSPAPAAPPASVAPALEPTLLLEELGTVLAAVTFLVFGGVILPAFFGHLTWQIALYAVLSLTVIRMLPVAAALLGSHARARTVAFLGWFGPRGLASIVFAVIILEETQGVPATNTVLAVIVATVALSVYAHGLTAAPLTARYAHWYAAHPRRDKLMEAKPVASQRWRALPPRREAEPPPAVPADAG